MAWKIGINYVSAQPDFEIGADEDGAKPWGFGWGALGWGAGHSLIGRPVPKRATQTDSKKLVDIFPLPGFVCVGERFRAIVESFEPGVHEFYPIELRSRKGVLYEEPYFLINVCQSFDAILVKGIDLEWGRMAAVGLEGMPYPRRLVTGAKPPLPISKPTIAGRHLWLDYWVFGRNGIMVSDQLRTALMDAKIRRLMLKEPWATRFVEIDTPFDYREQVPQIVDWMEANRPAEMLERHRNWVKAYMPNWLQ